MPERAGPRGYILAFDFGLRRIGVAVGQATTRTASALETVANGREPDWAALDRLIREFDLTHAEAAEAVGRSRAAVSNLLRLLDLSDKVKPLLESRELEMGHARALLAISSAVQQLDAARQVVKKGLSVRETERLVRGMLDKSGKKKAAKPADSADADIRRLEMDVSDKIGAKVRLQHTKKGSGKIVISYNSLDELDGILKHIK